MNILDIYPLVANMSCGEGGGVNFVVNVHQYFRYYFLTNTIYPK